jgi:hypothetical protein
MGLSNGFIQWVYPMGLSNGFIQVSCREVIQEWLSDGFTHLFWINLCCPASLCPRHPNPSHTVNPDLYTGLLIRTLTKVLTTVVIMVLDKCRASISRNGWDIALWVGH